MISTRGATVGTALWHGSRIPWPLYVLWSLLRPHAWILAFFVLGFATIALTKVQGDAFWAATLTETMLLGLYLNSNWHFSKVTAQALTIERRYAEELISLRKTEFNSKHDVSFGNELDNDSVDISTEMYRLLERVVDRTAAVARQFTQAPCAVTVKLIGHPPQETKSQEPHVYTFLRDSVSRATRHEDPDGFLYSANTAFANLLDLEPKRARFESADLEGLEKQGRYLNANPSWKKFYNKVIVLPICRSTSASDRSIIGFLCVDSILGDVTAKTLRNRLVVIAEYIYSTFGILYALIDGDSGKIGWIRSTHGIVPTHKAVQQKVELVLERLVKEFRTDPNTANNQLTALENSRQGVSSGSLVSLAGEKDMSPLIESSENCDGAAAALKTGIESILKAKPEVALAFERSFRKRAKIVDLSEAEGMPRGLVRVLSSLLRLQPPLGCQERYSSRRGDAESEAPTTSTIELKLQFELAIALLVAQYPTTLLRFNRNLAECQVSAETSLGSLMLFYSGNEDAYPY